jgi:hypothetical protein
MDELDLDSFIANIEQTAPDEPAESKLACKECSSKLEEDEEGNLTCPVCYVQATNILQFDETELHHDEQGRAVYGQRVALADRRVKQVDYGWAWSTDEAVVHILSLQLDALEGAKLLPDLFRPAVTNMWLKYWLETVAPCIKDEYHENELMPISSSNALKLRDIEVLFKVKDKIMVPLRPVRGKRSASRIYHMLGTDFTLGSSPDISSADDDDGEHYDDEGQLLEKDHSSCSSISFDVGPFERVPDQLVDEFNKLMSNEPAQVLKREPEEEADEEDEEADTSREEGKVDKDVKQKVGDTPETRASGKTRNLSEDSVKVLTLNRTLAFIEATARCLPDDDPLFAADIIRACNQHIIPYYDSARFLPDDMKLTSRDRLMFHKTTPPTPIQLTRTASLLINNIYKEQLPKALPIPDLNVILKRFIKDMNLPDQLMDIVRDKVSFTHFPSTRPKVFVSSVNRRLPQYDRWAFAVLVYHLKILFNLHDEYLSIQKSSAQEASQNSSTGEKFFIMSDWIVQMGLRLDLIVRYDPYILYHPLGRLEKMEISSQLAKYIERQIDAKTILSDIKVRPGETHLDPNFRSELIEVLKRELRPPEGVAEDGLDDKLESRTNIRYPISDAIRRTQKLWLEKIDSDLRDLLFRDFSKHQLLSLSNLPKWSIYDNQVTMNAKSLCISQRWPKAFRVLLDVGAFLCMCKPVELVNEVRLVEESLQPHTRVIKRSSRLSQGKS